MSLQSKIYEIAEKTCTTTDLKITQPTSSAVIIINLLSFTNPKDAQRERERERGKSVCFLQHSDHCAQAEGEVVYSSKHLLQCNYKLRRGNPQQSLVSLWFQWLEESNTLPCLCHLVEQAFHAPSWLLMKLALHHWVDMLWIIHTHATERRMNKPKRKETSHSVRSSSPACSTSKHTILYRKNSCYVMEQGIGKELCSYGDGATHLQPICN